MLLSPGKHHINHVAGYQSFDTDIDVRANQKYEIKTQLPKGMKATSSSECHIPEARLAKLFKSKVD